MAATADLGSYKDAMIVLGTASVVVPLVHRFKISPILGFLLAGALLGPNGLGALQTFAPFLQWITVSDSSQMALAAELGVVFLLFVIGLELSLPRLLTMRRLVFGFGSLQVVVSAVLIGIVAYWCGLSQDGALIAGAALALSSTAIVIEILAQQHRLSSATGRTSFSVLLFQDMAVVPLLIFVGIMANRDNASIYLGLAYALAQGMIAIGVIVILGRVVMRPLFRVVAATNNPELFLAATLFVAVGTSLITAAAGLSMALGAFIAGLLLAETEYHRAIEATIDPFKSLLLGAFFFTVGMNLDVAQVFSNPVLLVGTALLLIAVKALVVIGLARAFKMSWPRAIETGLLLGPAGEFAFVLIGIAVGAGLIAADAGTFVFAVASLTMAALPGLAFLGRKIAMKLEPARSDPELIASPTASKGHKAIVVGYGRVGRVISDMLDQHVLAHIVIDREPVLVTKWRREGKPIYFGDARQPLFLERSGLLDVKALIITIHDQAEIDRIVQAVRAIRSDVVIVSRARDAQHASHLYEMGVTDAVPETIEASLQLSEAALIGLGVPTGPVIASIHEKRDEFRHELQKAASRAGLKTRAIKAPAVQDGNNKKT